MDAPYRPQDPPAPGASSTAARRGEGPLVSALVGGAILLGMVLQTWIPPGPMTLVAGAALAGTLVLVLAFVVRGRLRQTLAGFRFVATLLFALAALAILGTLVIQGKPPLYYAERHPLLAPVIVGLELDDLFHGLPFALLMALFGVAVIVSAVLRWPPRRGAAGFLLCHLGLLLSLGGAAASSALAMRGRIDLHAGGDHAAQVALTKGGQPTGEVASLGFVLALDRFEAQAYETEFRVGYYERTPAQDGRGARDAWKLVASFDPDLASHRLPGGDSFRLQAIYPDAARPVAASPADLGASGWRDPAVAIEAVVQGAPRKQLLSAAKPGALFLTDARALTFERRREEKKAYVSWVTARHGADEVKRVIKVNEPMRLAGWTLYQVNYDPADPTYSGLEAVFDPGVSWVFAGFALICLGVFWMFYVDPRVKARAASPSPAARG